jgi:hypothetical protein
MRERILMCVYVCVWVWAYVHVSVYTCVYVCHACLYICVWVSSYIRMCVCVSVSGKLLLASPVNSFLVPNPLSPMTIIFRLTTESSYVYVWAYLYRYICPCECICTYIHIYECMSVFRDTYCACVCMRTYILSHDPERWNNEVRIDVHR